MITKEFKTILIGLISIIFVILLIMWVTKETYVDMKNLAETMQKRQDLIHGSQDVPPSKNYPTGIQPATPAEERGPPGTMFNDSIQFEKRLAFLNTELENLYEDART